MQLHQLGFQPAKHGRHWHSLNYCKDTLSKTLLSQLGFQPSKQGREELPEVKLQSLIVITNTTNTK